MDSIVGCACPHLDQGSDPTEYLEALKKKYLDRTSKLQAQQMELEKKIMQMELFLGKKDNRNISDDSNCSCEGRTVPKIFPETPVRDVAKPKVLSDIEQKPIVQQCSFFQKMMENAKSILSIKCQCASAFVSAKSTSITANEATSSDLTPTGPPTRENDPISKPNIAEEDTTLTDKSSKTSICTCEESDPSTLQEASCSCHLDAQKVSTVPQGQQVSLDKSSTPQESQEPTSSKTTESALPSKSNKNCYFDKSKNTTTSDLTSSCSCENCMCTSSILDEKELELDNFVDTLDAVPKISVFSEKGDNLNAEVQAVTAVENKGLNIQVSKDMSNKCVTCCRNKACPINRDGKDAGDNLNAGIQVASHTQNKAVNIIIPKETLNAAVSCCRSKSCPNNQRKTSCQAICSSKTSSDQSDDSELRKACRGVCSRTPDDQSSDASTGSKGDVCRGICSKTPEDRPDGSDLPKGDAGRVIQTQSEQPGLAPSNFDACLEKCETTRQDGQNQCAFIGSPLLNPNDFAASNTPKQISAVSSKNKLPYNTPAGQKKICQCSGYSLTSNDIIEIQNIADLAKKEKEMKAHIEELQKREKAYQEATKNVETLANQSCNCQATKNSTNIEDEVRKISQELRLENQILKSELADMKIELKHCLEKVEGPMKQKLEVEKRKCEVLQQKLQDNSKSMLLNQDTYTREMNDLKLQLCCACSNITELNQMNGRLQEEMSQLDCLCAKLEDDLVKQKINEAETIKRLTNRRFSGDGPKAQPSEESRCDSNLDVIARKLSKTIKELAPCEECSKLPAELAGAAKCIKDLTDMVRKRRTKSSAPNVCTCSSRPPSKAPSRGILEEECCSCCSPTDRGDKKETAKAKQRTTKPPSPYACTCQSKPVSKPSSKSYLGGGPCSCSDAPKDGGGESARIQRTQDEKTVRTLLSVPESFVQKGDSSKLEVDAQESIYRTPMGDSLVPCAKIGRPCLENKGTVTREGDVPKANLPCRDIGEPCREGKNIPDNSAVPCVDIGTPCLESKGTVTEKESVPRKELPCFNIGEPCQKGKPSAETKESVTTKKDLPCVDIGEPCQKDKKPVAEISTQVSKADKSCKAPCSEILEPVKDQGVEAILAPEAEKDTMVTDKALTGSQIRRDMDSITQEIIDKLPDAPEKEGGKIEVQEGLKLTGDLDTGLLIDETYQEERGEKGEEPVAETLEPEKDSGVLETAEEGAELAAGEGDEEQDQIEKPKEYDESEGEEKLDEFKSLEAGEGLEGEEHEEFEELEEYKEPAGYEKPEEYEEGEEYEKPESAGGAVKTKGREIPFDEIRRGEFPVDVENKAYAMEEAPEDLQITTTITDSGTLEVTTEGPTGMIETTLTYTEDGNIEVFTKMVEYADTGDQKSSPTEQALEKYTTEPTSQVPCIPEKNCHTMETLSDTEECDMTMPCHDMDTTEKPKLKAVFPIASSKFSGPSGPEYDTPYTPSSTSGEGELTSKLATGSSGVPKAVDVTPDLTTAALTSSVEKRDDVGKPTKPEDHGSGGQLLTTQRKDADSPDVGPQDFFKVGAPGVVTPEGEKPQVTTTGSGVKDVQSGGLGSTPSAQDAIRQDIEGPTDTLTSEGLTSTGADMPSGDVFTPDQLGSEAEEEPQIDKQKLAPETTPPETKDSKSDERAGSKIHADQQPEVSSSGRIITGRGDTLQEKASGEASGDFVKVKKSDDVSPEEMRPQITPTGSGVKDVQSGGLEATSSAQDAIRQDIEGPADTLTSEGEEPMRPEEPPAEEPVEAEKEVPTDEGLVQEEIPPAEDLEKGEKEVPAEEEFVDSLEKLPPEEGAGEAIAPEEQVKSLTEVSEAPEDTSKKIGDTLEQKPLPDTSPVGPRKTCDGSCQSKDQKDQSCQCCECKTIGVTTSGDKETITAEEAMCKTPLEDIKTDTDSEFVTTSEKIDNALPKGHVTKKSAKIKPHTKRDWSLIIDEKMLEKHPVLAGKTSEEQQNILASLGYVRSESRFSEVLDEYPELEDKNAGQVDSSIDEESVVVEATVEIGDIQKKPLGDLDQATPSKISEEKIPEAVQPKEISDFGDTPSKTTGDEIRVDSKILAKHPELSGKSKEEQQNILKNLGYKPSGQIKSGSALAGQESGLTGMSSKEKAQMASTAIDQEMSKTAELASRSSKQQELGDTIPQTSSKIVDQVSYDKHPEPVADSIEQPEQSLGAAKTSLEIQQQDEPTHKTPKTTSKVVDKALLEKHPELIGKSSEEQQRILENLGFSTPKAMSIIIDEDMRKKHPELVGKSSQQQQQILANLGYTTHKSPLVIINQDVLDKHPDLVGKSSKEQREMLEALGYAPVVTPKEQPEVLIVDKDMLDKHPELKDKTPEEQQEILSNLGYQPAPEETPLETSDVVLDKHLEKQPEVAADLAQKVSSKTRSKEMLEISKPVDKPQPSSKDVSITCKAPCRSTATTHDDYKKPSEKDVTMDKISISSASKSRSPPQTSKLDFGKQSEKEPKVTTDLIYKVSSKNRSEEEMEISEPVEKPQPSSKEISISCKAPCRSASTIHDDQAKPSEKDITLGEISISSASKSRSVSLQQKPSSQDDSATCKASCRTISVQNSAAKAAKKIISSSTTSSSSETTDKDKSKQKDKLKSRPGEVPPIVSQLSDRERPIIEPTKKPRNQRKKRSTRLMDCLKCVCPEPCNCVVCTPERLEARTRPVGRPIRSCECPPQMMQMAYSMPLPSHAPDCTCNQCILNPCRPCRPDLNRRFTEGESPTSDENDARKIRKHPSDCECVDCLCLPKIKKLAETKEYPVVYDKKQVYQVKTNCGTCANAQNARRYIEQQRSRIPISTTSSNPPRAKPESKQAIDAVKSEGPSKVAQGEEKKPPDPSGLSHSDSVYNSIACDCPECKCAECPDPKLTKAPVKGSKKDCCCTGPCVCEPCSIEELTKRLQEAQTKLAAAQAEAQAAAQAAAKAAAQVPVSAVPQESSTAPFTTAPPSVAPSSTLKPHDEDCTCAECVCPRADLMPSKTSKPATGEPSTVPSKDVTTKKTSEECTCPECVTCPRSDLMRKGPGGESASSPEPPSTKPSTAGDEEECTCPECVCPGADTITPKPEVPAADTMASKPDVQTALSSEPKKTGGVEGHPPDCDCPECSCPGLDDFKKGISAATPSEPVAAKEAGGGDEDCDCQICECPGRTSLPPTGGLADCDCEQCICAPCADPKRQKVTGAEQEPGMPGFIAECDCADCKCSPCADPKKAKDYKPESQVTEKGVVKHPEDCDCPECVCPGDGDVPAKESKGIGVPEKIEHPPDCDCDECLCLEEVIKTEPGKDHPEDCDCPICACPGAGDVARMEKGIQPTADKAVEKAEHPPDCDCEECKCPGLQPTADKAVEKAEHPPDCECEDCPGLADQVIPPTVADQAVPSGVADQAIHSPNCACPECLCPECIAPHAVGCRCDQCVCQPCDYKAEETVRHPQSCSCIKCLCDKCVEPNKQGAVLQHPQSCCCIKCLCDKCIEPNKQKAVLAAVEEKHGDGCKCIECLCKECLFKMEPLKHEEGCKCLQCTCVECLKMISTGGDKLDASARTISTGGDKLDASARTISKGDQKERGTNCVCENCICIDCSGKKNKPDTVTATSNEVGASTANVPPATDCTCPVCQCPGLASKAMGDTGTPSPPHGDKCSCPTCQCKPCPKIDDANDQPCACSECNCTECTKKRERKMGDEVTGTTQSAHDDKCDCPTCQCKPCFKKGEEQPCTCPECNCIKCIKKREQKMGDAVTASTTPPAHDDKCDCATCQCQPCFKRDEEQPCTCPECKCIKCNKKREIKMGDAVTATTPPAHDDKCDCAICQCKPCPKRDEEEEQPCTCPECKCIKCTKKRETQAATSQPAVKEPTVQSSKCNCPICRCESGDTTKDIKSTDVTPSKELRCICSPRCTCEESKETVQSLKCVCSPVCKCESGGETAKSDKAITPGKRDLVIDPPAFEPPQRIDCDCNKCSCYICASKKGGQPQISGKRSEKIGEVEDTREAPPFEVPIRMDCICGRCDCVFCNKSGPVTKEMSAQPSRGLTTVSAGPPTKEVAAQPSRGLGLASQAVSVQPSKLGPGEKAQGCSCEKCICPETEPVASAVTTKSSGKAVVIKTSAPGSMPAANPPTSTPGSMPAANQPTSAPALTPIHCDCPTCTCNEGEIKNIILNKDSTSPSAAATSARSGTASEAGEVYESAATLELPKPTLKDHLRLGDIHPVPCNCSLCKCKPCADPNVQAGQSVKQVEIKGEQSVKQMDNLTLVRSIQAANKENCECKEQIAEIKKTLERIRCACTEAEFRSTQSIAQTMGQHMEPGSGKPFVKQASVFGQTMSGLKMALTNLQAKCRAKDKMIEAMTGELEIRGSPDVFDKVLDKALKPTGALIDYDQAEDVKSLDRSQLATNVIYPPVAKTDQGTAPCDLRCLASKSVEVRTHKHKKKKEKEIAAKNLDCSCSKPQIIQKEEKDCQKLDLTGFEVIDIRRITEDSLIVKWNPPKCPQVTGYDIYVNGTLASKVMSGTRTSAMMHSLDLKKSVQITIYSVSKCGRIEPPAIAIYEIKS